MVTPTQPPAPRRYHHGNLRDALLRRAEEVLAAGGVDDLSLRALARDVGVSHAAPRRHFADRRALLDALAIEGFGRLGAALAGADPGPDAPLMGRLTAVAEAYVAFAVGHAALLDLMYAGKHRPGVSAALTTAAEHAFAAPLQVVADGQAAGHVVAGDVQHVATAPWAAIHGLAAMAHAGLVEREALGDLVPETVERLVLGLRPRS